MGDLVVPLRTQRATIHPIALPRLSTILHTASGMIDWLPRFDAGRRRPRRGIGSMKSVSRGLTVQGSDGYARSRAQTYARVSPRDTASSPSSKKCLPLTAAGVEESTKKLGDGKMQDRGELVPEESMMSSATRPNVCGSVRHNHFLTSPCPARSPPCPSPPPSPPSSPSPPSTCPSRNRPGPSRRPLPTTNADPTSPPSTSRTR